MLDDFPLHDDRKPPSKPNSEIFHFKPEDIDLAKELAEQYGKAKTLYATIETDPDVPPNQKAQVINSLTSIIAQITKTQAEVHSLNQVKRLENALIATLKAMPEDLQNAFYAAYEEELNGKPA